MPALTRETLGLIVGAAVLVVAFGIAILMDRIVGSIDGATFVAILLFPLIVYAIVSGRVAEFTGPGGWGAKFRDAAISQVETNGIVENVDELQAVAKGGLGELSRRINQLNPNVPNALTLRIGRSGYYRPSAILKYLKTLEAVGPSTHVVFVSNETGQFVGSANASQVIAMLETRRTEGEFMRELEQEDGTAFNDFGFLVRQSLEADESNSQALQKFVESNAQALVVVSAGDRKPVGIVDKNRLMTKLMVKLAGE